MTTPESHTMRSICSQFAILLALAGTGLLSAEMRSWTLEQSGKSFRGEYIEREADCITVRVKGKERKIGLDRLSEEDRLYVQSLAERNDKHDSNKNFSERWPTATTVEDKLRAKAVLEDDAQGNFIYETSHFRFYSPEKLSLPTVSAMGRVFEGTYTACRALPLNFPCRRFGEGSRNDGERQEKMVARLYATREEYARAVGPAYARTAGIFREPEILVPFDSLGIEKKGNSYAMASGGKLDTSTLIHELTHQMSLPGATYDVPIWFAEGIAEYMQLAPYSNGKFNFRGVKKNLIPYIVGGPGTRGRQLGRHLIAPPLEDMLNLSVRGFQSACGDATQFNYGFSALLVYYFIHLDGRGDGERLKSWMSHLQGTERATARLRMMIPADASPAEIEAAQQQLQQQALGIREEYYYAPLLDGRSWQELEAEFSKKVEKELDIIIQFGTPSE